MKRNFGNPSQSLPVTHPTRRHPTRDATRPAFYSTDFAEMVSGGFLVAFAIFCASLFGVIVFFASLIIEPPSYVQLVEYQHHLNVDR